MIARPGSPEKKQETRDAQKVLRLLDKKLKQLGFVRTKHAIFTRPAAHVLEFVHAHKYSFAPSFRIHFGVRVRSDDFPGAHLNGPVSEEMPDPDLPTRRRYEFTYIADDASLAACADAMFECVSNEGIRWFASVSDVSTLLSSNSPLMPTAIAALKRELGQPQPVQASSATRKALNAA